MSLKELETKNMNCVVELIGKRVTDISFLTQLSPVDQI